MRPAMEIDIHDTLDALIEKGAAAAGLVVRQSGEVLVSAASGFASGLSTEEASAGIPLRLFTPQTKMRVASVSKMGVALTALRLSQTGAFGLDDDASTWWPGLVNPAFPNTPITTRHLLSHTSTLIDPDAYWVAAPGEIESVVNGDVWSAIGPPGDWFTYCNLNYGIAATVLERISGERFDRLANRLALEPSGLGSAGYNWAGVPQSERRAGATLYRFSESQWRVQTDGTDTLNDTAPSGLVETGFQYADYQVGSNGTLFSPQGGLRASLEDMANLAGSVSKTVLTQPVWQADAARSNGQTEGGLYLVSGTGVFSWPEDQSPIPGYAMVGHDGEAYGLYSGAWSIPALDAQIAFAVTGTPDGEQPPGVTHSGYNIWSQTLFDLAARRLGLIT